MMAKKKDNRGGSRIGSGRTKGEETTTISIRHKKSVIEKVKETLTGAKIQKAGQEWLDGLVKTSNQK